MSRQKKLLVEVVPVDFDFESIKCKIGENVRNFRKPLGLTQNDLGFMVGYKESSAKVNIANIENGLLDIPLSKLCGIAVALNVTVASLLDGTEFDTARLTGPDAPDQKLLDGDAWKLFRLFTALNASGKAKALEYLRDISFNSDMLMCPDKADSESDATQQE